VVIGSENSSNTLALERTARLVGCPRVLRVNGAGELPDDLEGCVGVIAGASAPEALVDGVVAALAPGGGVEEIHAVVEDEYFPEPPELRSLTRQLASLLATLAFAPGANPEAGGGRAVEDRHVGASQVLAALVPLA
jgi:4-hydroxy-3-methylbut-2-enyl diphosphate reductase